MYSYLLEPNLSLLGKLYFILDEELFRWPALKLESISNVKIIDQTLISFILEIHDNLVQRIKNQIFFT